MHSKSEIGSFSNVSSLLWIARCGYRLSVATVGLIANPPVACAAYLYPTAVHCAAVGAFSTLREGSRFGQAQENAQDHRYMLNVVTSAIVNTPPPVAVLRMVNKLSDKEHKTMHDLKTDETMVREWSLSRQFQRLTAFRRSPSLPRTLTGRHQRQSTSMAPEIGPW